MVPNKILITALSFCVIAVAFASDYDDADAIVPENLVEVTFFFHTCSSLYFRGLPPSC